MSYNPFMNNTPHSSPIKNTQDRSSDNNNGYRLRKKQSSNYANASPVSSISSTSQLLTSPFKRSRNAGSRIYNDRFIPSRTAIDLNTMMSITNTNIDYQSNEKDSLSITEDQIELQKEREANHTFDTILKNELFGEKIINDFNSIESSIDRIQNTKSLVRIKNNIRLNDSLPTLHNPLNNSTSSYGNRSDYDDDDNTDEVETDVDDFDSEENASGNNNRVPSTPPHNVNRTSDYSSNSEPVTPRRLNMSQQADQQSFLSNYGRGASLLTYTERRATRPSTESILQTQFNNSSSVVRPDSKQLLLSPKKKTRQIAKIPYRVLDAPSLADDFYYDLIDWSSRDVLAVALGKSIFLTDNNNGDVIHLCDTDNEFTSLNWVGTGSHLAVGQSNGLVEIYDIIKRKCIRTLSGHSDRVSCLSWNNHILSSGSRDRKILHRDVRSPDSYFTQIETHTQEVCGLKWNIEDNRLASGGNDNIVYVYDGVNSKPTLMFTEHTAAVKAMTWSPHRRGILATGGGTADRRLKIWNVNTSAKLNDVDSGSQICNMIWSKNTDEIVTSHGYSRYNLTLWNYPTLEPVAIFKGHSFRVLHLTLSEDGTTVVSGAGDETLRYWKIFNKPKAKAQPESLIFESFYNIR
ncbi:hypothetical protein TPHA_0F00770 [Tetrapisispora phaffii CBS 4417]|uniref:CDC20/Fizzy WD40 domain-containing protein n=1 Tax=Tetrapisispora phaffii (strain ATCC 24235 / CBS 4417 / NBRC 1672 / NRRL Y-8282 / UCD 70-5) TaxID=1071381 RepID=G8BUY1_TETPH|nr:hypothetical protein TPHA_0F00770 [Tetrapisispora phaffii CBS 4417]CCE63563.1 hypothetical protein TPHA_0F00770 [Tetrapisispora phaffii CBS 4417]